MVSVGGNGVPKTIPSLKNVKHSLRKPVMEIPMEVVCTLVNDWTKRFQTCVKSKDDHFD